MSAGSGKRAAFPVGDGGGTAKPSLMAPLAPTITLESKTLPTTVQVHAAQKRRKQNQSVLNDVFTGTTAFYPSPFYDPRLQGCFDGLLSKREPFLGDTQTRRLEEVQEVLEEANREIDKTENVVANYKKRLSAEKSIWRRGLEQLELAVDVGNASVERRLGIAEGTVRQVDRLRSGAVDDWGSLALGGSGGGFDGVQNGDSGGVGGGENEGVANGGETGEEEDEDEEGGEGKHMDMDMGMGVDTETGGSGAATGGEEGEEGAEAKDDDEEEEAEEEEEEEEEEEDERADDSMEERGGGGGGRDDEDEEEDEEDDDEVGGAHAYGNAKRGGEENDEEDEEEEEEEEDDNDDELSASPTRGGGSGRITSDALDDDDEDDDDEDEEDAY